MNCTNLHIQNTNKLKTLQIHSMKHSTVDYSMKSCCVSNRSLIYLKEYGTWNAISPDDVLTNVIFLG